jgi:hypothetical protein
MTTFTSLHVILSLVGIGTGIAVAVGLLAAKNFERLTFVFLATTVLTSVTGFMFPFHQFLPSHGVGIVSLLVLGVAIVALYVRHLSGVWRRTYVISAMIALYLNVFVLIAQLFMKVPGLKALAPTQSELPFKLTQLAALAFFALLTTLAAIRFGAKPVSAVPVHAKPVRAA